MAKSIVASSATRVPAPVKVSCPHCLESSTDSGWDCGCVFERDSSGIQVWRKETQEEMKWNSYLSRLYRQGGAA
jgi:hypothetical protein